MREDIYFVPGCTNMHRIEENKTSADGFSLENDCFCESTYAIVKLRCIKTHFKVPNGGNKTTLFTYKLLLFVNQGVGKN